MKKILIFYLAFIILTICGCTDDSLYTVSYPEPVVVSPDEETTHTINGYKDTTSSDKIESSVETQTTSKPQSSNYSSSKDTESVYDGKFLGNKNTKKLHKTSCSYIKNTKEENIDIFENANDALNAGYSACKRCMAE